MVFRPSQKHMVCYIEISIDIQHIVRVKETVVLDENLNWKSEIFHVANKEAKSIGIINKSVQLLPS